MSRSQWNILMSTTWSIIGRGHIISTSGHLYCRTTLCTPIVDSVILLLWTRRRHNELKMVHIPFTFLAMISSVNLIAASILTSALSESNILLSDEGYLIYSSLPDITKAHLFRNYMDEYGREVSIDPTPLVHAECYRLLLIFVLHSCAISSIQRRAR
jgi:hypothetical protein